MSIKKIVIKYENVELHDEKNYKIDLLRRTKKRVNNVTNDTYKKKTLMLMTRAKLTKEKRDSHENR